MKKKKKTKKSFDFFGMINILRYYKMKNMTLSMVSNKQDFKKTQKLSNMIFGA